MRGCTSPGTLRATRRLRRAFNAGQTPPARWYCGPGHVCHAARGNHGWRGSTPMATSSLDMPMATPMATSPIHIPVARSSPPCNLPRAQYPHAARPRRRATGSRRPGPDQTPNGQPGVVPCAVERRNAISSSCSRCTPAWSARADRPRLPAAGRPFRARWGSAGRWPAPPNARSARRAAPYDGRAAPHQRVFTYAAQSAGNAIPVRCVHKTGL